MRRKDFQGELSALDKRILQGLLREVRFFRERAGDPIQWVWEKYALIRLQEAEKDFI